jgi:FkbM family methyltransferase
MKFTRGLRRCLEYVTRTHIYRVLPRGVDVAYDIARAFPNYRVQTVFDIGANVGQSTAAYLDGFPNCRIFCFEPVRDTFARLQTRMKGYRSVECFQLALTDARGTGRMALEGRSSRFYLLKSGRHDEPRLRTEVVNTSTLDAFCNAHAVDRISYVKIDTEGSDLEVLMGADDMLARQRIDFVEVEAGVNPGNTRHVPFEVLKSYLELRGYLLFAIYAQMHEWPTRQPHLRRINSTFVSSHLTGQPDVGATPPAESSVALYSRRG